MSLAQQTGISTLTGEGWRANVLAAPPLIAPARQFVFPFAVAGEEEAMARGALWLQVRVEGEGTWLAQCALGFTSTGVAHGLWPLPQGKGLLACAGGYAYAVDPRAPERTTLLPLRPAVGVIPSSERTILIAHQHLAVRETSGELWETPRLSWEGVTVTAVDDHTVRGTGWDMMDDAEVPFTVDLLRRTSTGGGYDRGTSPSAARR